MQGIKFFGGKVGYRFLPKVACTSIKEEIYRIEEGVDFQYEKGNVHVHKYMGRKKYRRSIDSCDFRFIVIRDPVKRFLSAYSNRVLHLKEISKSYVLSRCPDLYDSMPEFNPDLDVFIKSLDVYMKIMSIKHHVKPIVEFLENETLDFFSYVYKIEETSKLAADLSGFITKDVRFGESQTGGIKIQLNELSKSQLEFLIDFYSDDYELLKGYYSAEALRAEWRASKSVTAASIGSSDGPASRENQPFIIWTLQRTGGTNLSQRLIQRSPFNGIQHEPFNKGRVFGHVTNHWKQHKDNTALELAISDICDSHVTIKHCVEMVPAEVTQVLARISSEKGYRHLFLYRQNPLGRILSLYFAKMSGIWGPDLRDNEDIEENIFAEPLPVSDLLAHEIRCAKLLNMTWSQLKSQGDMPYAISYEEIYRRDGSDSFNTKMLGMLAYLELSKGATSDQQFIKAVVGTGDQGTRSKYAAFKGIDELQQGLDRIELFQPYKRQLSLAVHDSYKDCAGITYAAIDTKPDWVQEGEPCMIEGVVVIDKLASDYLSLLLVSDSGELEVKCGLKSAWMAKKYPDALNCQTARFRVPHLIAEPNMEYRLCIARASGGMAELFRIKTSGLEVT